MKKKIEEALRTEFKELGLGDKTIGRLADYIVSKGTVTNEEEIATAVKGDDVKLIAKSIQGEIDGIQKAKKKAEDDLADYMAKHPSKPDKGGEGEGEDPDDDDDDDDKPLTAKTIAKLIKESTEAAVKTVKDEFDAYKAQNSAKEAKAKAKEAFFANKWTTKFKDEAEDAWDRAFELNEAKGGKMTAEELSGSATEYFNKLVKRKGVDATKPFEAGKEKDGEFDFSSTVKHLEEAGKLQPEQSN